MRGCECIVSEEHRYAWVLLTPSLRASRVRTAAWGRSQQRVGAGQPAATRWRTASGILGSHKAKEADFEDAALRIDALQAEDNSLKIAAYELREQLESRQELPTDLSEEELQTDLSEEQLAAKIEERTAANAGCASCASHTSAPSAAAAAAAATAAACAASSARLLTQLADCLGRSAANQPPLGRVLAVQDAAKRIRQADLSCEASESCPRRHARLGRHGASLRQGQWPTHHEHISSQRERWLALNTPPN